MLPFRSAAVGLGWGPRLAAAEPPVDGAAATLGAVVAEAPQAATMAPTTLGAIPSASSRVTNVRRDIWRARYEFASSSVCRSSCLSIEPASSSDVP